MWQYITRVLTHFQIIDIIDIIIVAFALYKVMMLIRGTRAVQLLKGVGVLLTITVITGWLGLNTINWLLTQTMTVGLVALPIIFYPELRKALEQLGRGKFFKTTRFLAPKEFDQALGDLVRGVVNLAKSKTGALIVIERETGLNEHIESGVILDAVISSQLIINIFVEKTPLHDGAVIIRGNRVVAATCYLPLSENTDISKDLGTRHRAGLGISEVSDAIVVMVSEETGVISVAQNGKLTRYLDEKTLREMLSLELQSNEQESSSLWPWRW
ncbi:TIGR00159 family protein [Alkalicella caledoniensis]|uniref:Diadenylate cyclase n=1 Tax=Alkalicella caledoniensis TaxID=2731377 RepID=A0A7G9W7S3_ALKCA|nr:diadenylate cyclase CdaA [Alkalicella caledoniensis]QNO14735.1 TIGR00159 family protein [Alkalicella caledoniensis]